MFGIMYAGADDLHKDTECPDMFNLPSSTDGIKMLLQKRKKSLV